MYVEDIARFFPTPDDADAAFVIFDKDMNGDINRDEIEMACMYVSRASSPELSLMTVLKPFREVHREQLSIEHSMRDLDSAVGRLDNILMSVYFIVVILIFAVTLVSCLGLPK